MWEMSQFRRRDLLECAGVAEKRKGVRDNPIWARLCRSAYPPGRALLHGGRRRLFRGREDAKPFAGGQAYDLE